MKKIFRQNGFSILEIAVAIGIISVALLGIMSLSLQNIKVQNTNRGQLTASMLAQEGLELARNIRDENWITNPEVDWDLNLNDSDGTFIIDYRGRDEINFTPNDFTSDLTILYTDGSGVYSHDSSGTATKYRRLVTITETPINGSEYYLKVDSVVEWHDSGQKHNYKAVTELYDWR